MNILKLIIAKTMQNLPNAIREARYKRMFALHACKMRQKRIRTISYRKKKSQANHWNKWKKRRK